MYGGEVLEELPAVLLGWGKRGRPWVLYTDSQDNPILHVRKQVLKEVQATGYNLEVALCCPESPLAREVPLGMVGVWTAGPGQG